MGTTCETKWKTKTVPDKVRDKVGLVRLFVLFGSYLRRQVLAGGFPHEKRESGGAQKHRGENDDDLEWVSSWGFSWETRCGQVGRDRRNAGRWGGFERELGWRYRLPVRV